MDLKEKKLFLLAMDGTIYLDQELFDGTLDFLEHVKKIGGRAMYLTNNSSKSVNKYIEKLGSMGINAEAKDFTTSAQATALYLLKTHKDDLLYVFGTQALKDELVQYGLNITDKICDEIKCLVMGFDTELCFQKLEDACILLNRGVDYIATNPDWVCPTWYGSVPDCGSIAQILHTATKRSPKFIGKPEPTMIELAIEQTGFAKEQTIILGDRLYTDIASGSNAGIDTALMLSGESTMEDVKAFDGKAPTYIFDSIRAFLNAIQ
ncbi:MAG: HAD-IIA family hydrolase [Clostridia bacterium]|nr:HAD-IIA family hydrolase [Clostridia bacterium]